MPPPSLTPAPPGRCRLHTQVAGTSVHKGSNLETQSSVGAETDSGAPALSGSQMPARPPRPQVSKGCHFQNTPSADCLLLPPQPQRKGPCAPIPVFTTQKSPKKTLLKLASILKTVLFSALFLFRINSDIKSEQKDGSDFHMGPYS